MKKAKPKPKHRKEVIENARISAQWIYDQMLELDKSGHIGICVMIPIPGEVYGAILQIEDDVMPDLRRDLSEVASESIRDYLMTRMRSYVASLMGAGSETVQ